MKKTLMAAMAIVAITFGACKKDLTTQTAQEPKSATSKLKTNVATPSYYYRDLTLQPRQPGENFDTYTANFGLAVIKVTGSPSWDTNAYPNLENGVPTAGASISATPGYNAFVTMGNGTAGGDAFVVTVGVLGAFDGIKFQSDISKYRDARNAYEKDPDNTPLPLIWNYVSGSYSTQANVVNTPGKLIRVKTGSHWAIASMDYPLPAYTAGTDYETVGNVADPASPGTYYTLDGRNGKLKTDTRTPGVTAYGNYTHGAGTSIYHFYGTIKRANGTTFTFDITQDIA